MTDHFIRQLSSKGPFTGNSSGINLMTPVVYAIYSDKYGLLWVEVSVGRSYDLDPVSIVALTWRTGANDKVESPPICEGMQYNDDGTYALLSVVLASIEKVALADLKPRI